MPLLSMSTYNLNPNIYSCCIDFHNCFHVIFQYTLDISRLPYSYNQKYTHNPPVRARYGMSFEGLSSDYS